MTFKDELQELRKNDRQRKFPSSIEQYDERWGMLDSVKVQNSAANTERHVVEFLTRKGHQAQKVEVKGTYVAPKSERTQLGRIQISKGKYLPSGATKGAADISSSIYGIKVDWELKYSKSDRQSSEQKRFEERVKSSGGHYYVFHNVDDFYEQYNELMRHPQIRLMKDYHESNS